MWSPLLGGGGGVCVLRLNFSENNSDSLVTAGMSQRNYNEFSLVLCFLGTDVTLLNILFMCLHQLS